ncbi:MAG: glycoside hydrolase family 5 protein [Capsulimonadaceae bacterium]|nr:glycoside hydrolase family 5 protein [Capsulimonadaceae bacterium]
MVKQIAILTIAALTALQSSAFASTGSLGKPLETIYSGKREAGWTSLSTAKVDLACDAPVHSGPHSIRVELSSGTALEFARDAFDASRYGALTFWINGGPTGGQDNLVVRGMENGQPRGASPLPKLPAGEWVQEVVTLEALGLSQEPKMTGFRIEATTAGPVPAFYVDDIRLAASTRPLGRVPLPFKVAGKPLDLTGVNLSGGEFAHPKPGESSVYGRNFMYPNESEFDYFAAHGFNIIRLPFLWEVLQPALDKPILADELKRLKSTVSCATSKGLVVLLDPHDGDRYFGKLIGSPDAPNDAFAAFWSTMATEFKNNPRVYFGLVNEPNGVSPAQWFASAQAAVYAIRKAGAKNVILVPGLDFTGGHTWLASGSAIMNKIDDPINNTLFEVHQYLDEDNSGTHPDAISATIGSERLASFTKWCRATGKRAFLGEFGVAEGKQNRAAIDDMLGYMEANRDVWAGFTYWSAGPWWGDYMYSIEPTKAGDRPQLWYLLPHLHGIGKDVDPARVGARR